MIPLRRSATFCTLAVGVLGSAAKNSTKRGNTRVAGDPATELAPTDHDAHARAYEPSNSNR